MAVGRFGLDKVKFDVLLYIKRFGVKKLIVWIKEPLNRERGLPRCLNPNPSGDKELVKKPPKSASTQRHKWTPRIAPSPQLQGGCSSPNSLPYACPEFLGPSLLHANRTPFGVRQAVLLSPISQSLSSQKANCSTVLERLGVQDDKAKNELHWSR